MYDRGLIMRNYSRKLVCSAALLGCIVTSIPARTEIVEAQWKVYQVRFRFIGLNTAYTCDSIEHTLKRLLALLGARDDVRAESACTGQHRIKQVHRVRLAFAMPVPADRTDLSREIIPAKWEEVRVVGRLSRYLDPGDCELLEQFERQVLPLLHVQNVNKRIHCAPYHRQYNTMSLKMMALKAVESDELEERKDAVQDESSRPGN